MDTGGMCDYLLPTRDATESYNVDNPLRTVGQIVTVYCQNVTVAVVRCMPDLQWNATVPSCPTKDADSLGTMLIIVWAVGGVLLFALLVLVTIVISSRSKSLCGSNSNRTSSSVFHISGLGLRASGRGGDNPGFSRADERCGEWSFHRTRPISESNRLPSYHEAILNNYITVPANAGTGNVQTSPAFVRASAPPSYRTSQLQTPSTHNASDSNAASICETTRERINATTGQINTEEDDGGNQRVRNQNSNSNQLIENHQNYTSRVSENRNNNTSQISDNQNLDLNQIIRNQSVDSDSNNRNVNWGTGMSHGNGSLNSGVIERILNQSADLSNGNIRIVANQSTSLLRQTTNQTTLSQNIAANEISESQNMLSNQGIVNNKATSNEIFQDGCFATSNGNENQNTENNAENAYQFSTKEQTAASSMAGTSRGSEAFLSGSSLIARRYAEQYPQCFFEDEPPPPYSHEVAVHPVQRSPTHRTQQDIAQRFQNRRKSMHVIPSLNTHSNKHKSELQHNQHLRRSMHDSPATSLHVNSGSHSYSRQSYQNSSQIRTNKNTGHNSRRNRDTSNIPPNTNHQLNNAITPSLNSNHQSSTSCTPSSNLNINSSSLRDPSSNSQSQFTAVNNLPAPNNMLTHPYDSRFPNHITPPILQVPTNNINALQTYPLDSYVPTNNINTLQTYPLDSHVPTNNYYFPSRQNFMSAALINGDRKADKNCNSQETNQKKLYVIKGFQATSSTSHFLQSSQSYSLPFRSSHHFETQPLCTSTPLSQSPAVDRKLVPTCHPLSSTRQFLPSVNHSNEEQIIFQRVKAALEERHTTIGNQIPQNLAQTNQAFHYLYPSQGAAPIARLDSEFL